MSSTLCLHCGANEVTRPQLAELPDPEILGRHHRPVRHDELIDELYRQLEAQDLKATKARFAVYGKNGGLLFATLDVESCNGLNRFARDGEGFSLGLRSGNDQSFAIQIAAGKRIFVCDNLALNGDLIALCRKHTSGLKLGEEIEHGLFRYKEHVGALCQKLDAERNTPISAGRAKEFIFDAFHQDILPTRLFGPVARNFFDIDRDTRPDCADRTLFGLHNSFTRETQKLKARRKFDAEVKLGALFETAALN